MFVQFSPQHPVLRAASIAHWHRGCGGRLILEETAFDLPGLVGALVLTALSLDLMPPSPHESPLPVGTVVCPPEH